MSYYDTFDDATRPFDFADLNGKPDPEKWGPKYSKPIKTPRVNADRFPTNAPSGQKTAHVDHDKFRAKLRAEFQAQANADRVAWATGKSRSCAWGKSETIHDAYKQAMAEKRARLAAIEPLALAA